MLRLKISEVVSKYQPTGDQPRAISQLVSGINAGVKEQILLGATGTGKTFTISNVIKTVKKPTLVLSHNKTLAGQLYGELKEFFQTMRLSTSFLMITINLRPTSPVLIPLLEKILPSMMKSINYVIRLQVRFYLVVMSLLWLLWVQSFD